ncbi:12834_t:CDS:2 [Racocetra persica]|uniref:12834_t:CDS:1 n=1 Tax=Racocetra persica TaxID=160502 RepID=A0ACA9NYA7_9GLOM|nr:12834_t:CDS:2 [Racocetra persica]
MHRLVLNNCYFVFSYLSLPPFLSFESSIHVVPIFNFLPALFFILLAILAAKILYYVIYHTYISPLSKIPGPAFSSVTEILVSLKRPEGRVFEWFYSLHLKYGNVVRVGPKFILFDDLEAIKFILKDSDMPKTPSIAGIRAHYNLPTLFSATYVFLKLVQSLIKKIDSLSKLSPKSSHLSNSTFNQFNDDKPVINLYQLVQFCALDIIGETAFGGSFNMVETGSHPLPMKILDEMKRRVMCHTFPYFKMLFKKDPWCDEFISKMIKNRIEQNLKTTKKRIDILQILLNNHSPLKQSSPNTPIDITDGKTMSNFEILDQTMEFLIGGSDTSAFTINMAIIMLLQNPEKLKNLRIELESAFPILRNRVISSEHEDDLFLPSHDILKSLKYLNAVIDETLRLFPVTLGGIMRQTTKDTIISNYLIPKDTIVSASVWRLHRSKQIWGQDVDEFVPERWFDLNPKIRNDAYYPFGSGSRLCIGNNFAMMEIRIMLSSLIGNFNFFFRKDADLQIVQFITPSLRSKKFEVEVTRLRERKSNNTTNA